MRVIQQCKGQTHIECLSLDTRELWLPQCARPTQGPCLTQQSLKKRIHNFSAYNRSWIILEGKQNADMRLPQLKVSSKVSAPPIPGATEPDVVGEDGRTVDVVVAMHRINPVNERNGQPGVHGCFLEVVGHVVPLQHRSILGGSAASSAQYTSCNTMNSARRLY